MDMTSSLLSYPSHGARRLTDKYSDSSTRPSKPLSPLGRSRGVRGVRAAGAVRAIEIEFEGCTIVCLLDGTLKSSEFREKGKLSTDRREYG